MTSFSVVTASAQPAQVANLGATVKPAAAPTRDISPASTLNRTQTKLDNTSQDAPQVPSDLQHQLDNLAQNEAGGSQSVRMQIAYDENSGRVYGKVIDKNTNEVIRQVPSDKLLRLFAIGREQLAMVLDRKV